MTLTESIHLDTHKPSKVDRVKNMVEKSGIGALTGLVSGSVASILLGGAPLLPTAVAAIGAGIGAVGGAFSKTKWERSGLKDRLLKGVKRGVVGGAIGGVLGGAVGLTSAVAEAVPGTSILDVLSEKISNAVTTVKEGVTSILSGNMPETSVLDNIQSGADKILGFESGPDPLSIESGPDPLSIGMTEAVASGAALGGGVGVTHGAALTKREDESLS